MRTNAECVVNDSVPANQGKPCPECGQTLSFCKTCNAPSDKKGWGFRLAALGLVILSILLLIAYIVGYVVLARDPSILSTYLGPKPAETWQVLSSMGEMFGGLNCIVSALAFAALIYSIAQQRTELRYQRQAMAESRKEMRLSIQAQEDSARALSIQIEHMRLTATIDGLGAILRTYDAQIDFTQRSIAEIEPVADADQIRSERERLLKLTQARDAAVTKLDSALNEAHTIQKA